MSIFFCLLQGVRKKKNWRIQSKFNLTLIVKFPFFSFPSDNISGKSQTRSAGLKDSFQNISCENKRDRSRTERRKSGRKNRFSTKEQKLFYGFLFIYFLILTFYLLSFLWFCFIVFQIPSFEFHFHTPPPSPLFPFLHRFWTRLLLWGYLSPLTKTSSPSPFLQEKRYPHLMFWKKTN